MQKIFILYWVKVAVLAIGKRNVTNENVKKTVISIHDLMTVFF
jgi:hypothetical protein